MAEPWRVNKDLGFQECWELREQESQGGGGRGCLCGNWAQKLPKTHMVGIFVCSEDRYAQWLSVLPTHSLFSLGCLSWLKSSVVMWQVQTDHPLMDYTALEYIPPFCLIWTPNPASELEAWTDTVTCGWWIRALHSPTWTTMSQQQEGSIVASPCVVGGESVQLLSWLQLLALHYILMNGGGNHAFGHPNSLLLPDRNLIFSIWRLYKLTTVIVVLAVWNSVWIFFVWKINLPGIPTLPGFTIPKPLLHPLISEPFLSSPTVSVGGNISKHPSQRPRVDLTYVLNF